MEEGAGHGESVNSLGKKDIGCAADGVVAETLDGGTERMQERFAQRARVINQQGLHDCIGDSQNARNSGDPNRVDRAPVAPRIN